MSAHRTIDLFYRLSSILHQRCKFAVRFRYPDSLGHRFGFLIFFTYEITKVFILNHLIVCLLLAAASKTIALLPEKGQNLKTGEDVERVTLSTSSTVFKFCPFSRNNARQDHIFFLETQCITFTAKWVLTLPNTYVHIIFVAHTNNVEHLSAIDLHVEMTNS